MTSTMGNGNSTNFSLRHRGAKKHSSKQRHASGKINTQILLLAMIGMVFLLTVFANFVMVHKTANSETASSLGATSRSGTSSSSSKNRIALVEKRRADQEENEFCQLRRYPPHRYYLHSQAIKSAPSFLNTETEYIFGQWPILFQHSASSSLPKQLSKVAASSSSTLSILSSPPRKLCVDQSEWNPIKNVWPFADGTNPSILSVQRIQQQLASSSSTATTSKHVTKSDFEILLTAFPEAAYVATICMTNSQCTWRDAAQQIQEFRLRSTNQTQQPDAVLTVIQLLTHDFVRVAQATLILELDAPWGMGRQRKTSFREPTMIPAFDDARLFLHNGQIWVSYREGKLFGYESQVLNPIHWNVITDATANGGEEEDTRFSVSVKASETTSFCCGRNMALMENLVQPQRLQALTWVDPVTVETVDTTPHVQLRQDHPKAARDLRRDLQQTSQRKQQQQQPPKKSHIHGTNAFMVYLPDTKEFLGIGHFHRPNDRKPNPYARFGHHYTHNFYTISSKPPYRLTGLSPEFVLTKRGPSRLTKTAATGNDQNEHDDEKNDDAHIIQFVSGLELVVDQSMLILAYGINDCEAAVTTLSLESARSLLRPVPMGKQVVDFMQPLATKTTASSSAKI